MKFLITEASGKQYELETEKSHSLLSAEMSPTTDIQPIVAPAIAAAITEEVAPKKKTKKTAE